MLACIQHHQLSEKSFNPVGLLVTGSRTTLASPGPYFFGAIGLMSCKGFSDLMTFMEMPS